MKVFNIIRRSWSFNVVMVVVSCMTCGVVVSFCARYSRNGETIDHFATYSAQIHALNRFSLRHGGLGLCPEALEFFAQSVQDKRVVCEIGMGTGISALVFLLEGRNVTVHEFDVGGDGKRQVSIYLRSKFEERFKPHWGDFHIEIPKNAMQCDLIYVDAVHPADAELAMQHLGGGSAEWLYHDGGAGDVKAREYLLEQYKDNWNELSISDTRRTDGRRCVYYKGKLTPSSGLP